MGRKEGKEEDRQQGSLLASIGNIRGGAYFRGKAEEEGKERRGPYENESQKALNFAFLFDCFKCSQENL